MTSHTLPDAASLLSSTIAVPQHVVYRSFPSETVMLNLNTGRYHGLNPTAGRMLAALAQSGSLAAAAAAVGEHHGLPRATVERDLFALCAALLERGLIELRGHEAG
jgi:DNA-binding transcriptional ArsR family regulator